MLTPAQVLALREAEQVFRSSPDVFTPDDLEGIFWHIIDEEEALVAGLFPEVLQGALIIAHSLEVGRRWRQRNRDHLNQTAKQWCLENPEKRREQVRRWIQKNREKYNAQKRRYYHRQKAKASQ